MTDRCEPSGGRERNLSVYEPSCEPTHEEAATAQQAREQTSAREAEARRDAYIASGTDEGGRSRRASSDASVIARETKDDKTARVIANAKKYDPPIQSDAAGNALVGALGGGLVAGVGALAAGAESGAAAIAVGTTSAAKSLATTVIKELVERTFETGGTQLSLRASRRASPRSSRRRPSGFRDDRRRSRIRRVQGDG